MVPDNTTSLIVALQGTKNIENDGQVVSFSNKTNFSILRRKIAEKLHILGGFEDIVLFTKDNTELTDMDEIRKHKIVYVNLKQTIKKSLPGPSGFPFIGAAYEFFPDIDKGWAKTFKKHGPIVSVPIMGKKIIGGNSPEIAEIFLKESDYFTKKITVEGGLQEIRDIAGKGLFTTGTDEMDWKLAHKLLMPAFSARAVKAYQVEMGKIAQEAIHVFDQYKPNEPVEILEWSTNITFETIGRIGFGYRFNLLSDRDQPPNEFIEAMGFCLTEVIKRMLLPEFIKKVPLASNRKFDRSMKLMHDVVDTVIAERKNGKDAKNMDKDLLGYMLNARDEHQLGLSDEIIRDQVVTFLIAGHDTTANTIAWCLYLLARHPDVQAKVLQEIADNNITWDTIPSTEQVGKLKYLHQVLKETLRMYTPLRGITKYCQKDCILPGGYAMKKGQSVVLPLYVFHHNPDTYPDPEKFDPDRWTPEEEQKRSRYAWLPFSTGPRGCIGMAFALQEAKVILSMLLHKFDFRYEGPDVAINLLAATTKPKDLFMTIHPREKFPEPSNEATEKKNAEMNTATSTPKPIIPTAIASTDAELPPITFLFGTQTGTAHDYANQLAKQARNFGFKNITLTDMDKWKVLQDGKFITEQKGSHKRTDKELVVICTATYNGHPPDSAYKFNEFLDFKTNEEDHDHLLKGLSFAVFGLGNKNWRTYQSFPIKVNDCLEELGATCFFDRGSGDADRDMDAEFNEWCAHFWIYTLNYYQIATASESRSIIPVEASTVDQANLVKVNFIPSHHQEAHEQAKNNFNGKQNAILKVNHELQSENSPRSTRHIEIDISELSPIHETHKYSVGDHLEIMPENNKQDVESVARGFGFTLDAVFEIDQETTRNVSPRSLASNIKGPCSIRNMLTFYADLTSPPSRAMLGCFAAQLKLVSPETALTFKQLLMPDNDNKDHYPEFIKKHRTLLDLQQAYPQVNKLDLGQFLTSVPVLQPRRYSVATSPLLYPNTVHLAVSVVDDVIQDKHYPGLTSSFLKRSFEGTRLCAQLKSSQDTFYLPKDSSIPIIMISAGTGFAPFRGFLQHRQAQMESGQTIGKSMLFFGCRHKDQDYIYQQELKDYVSSGVLSQNIVVFSRDTTSSIRYVQHQLVSHASDVWNMICPTDPNVQPASIYVCGGVAMSNDVRRTLCDLAISFNVASNMEEANKFMDNLVDEKRYLCDVWG